MLLVCVIVWMPIEPPVLVVLADGVLPHQLRLSTAERVTQRSPWDATNQLVALVIVGLPVLDDGDVTILPAQPVEPMESLRAVFHGYKPASRFFEVWIHRRMTNTLGYTNL